MNTDLVERLIASGTPIALAMEVAAEFGRLRGLAEAAAKPDTTAEKRRAWDRDYRAARRATEKSGGSGGCRVDTADKVDAAPAPSPSFPPDPPTTPTHTPEGTTRARSATAWPVPEGVDPEHWRDLLANRRSKRLPNTPTAHRKLLADLAALSDDEWPPGRIVQHAAERGWGAIFDPREKRNGNRGQNRGGGQSSWLDA